MIIVEGEMGRQIKERLKAKTFRLPMDLVERIEGARNETAGVTAMTRPGVRGRAVAEGSALEEIERLRKKNEELLADIVVLEATLNSLE